MIRRIRELSKNEFVRNVFTLMSATSVAQGIAILIYLVLAKIYTTSEHGIFALYLSIIAVTGIMATGKYESAVMMPGDDKSAFDLVSLGSILTIFFSLLLLILVALFHESFALLLGDPMIEKWLWFVPLSTLMIGLFQSFSYWANRNKRFGNMAVANVGQSLTNSAIKVSTSKVFTGGGGLVVGSILGQFIGLALFVWDFLRKDARKIRDVSLSGMLEMAKEYKFFPRFNMVHSLINNFSGNLPIFVFASRFGVGEAGLYSFGFMMIFRPVNLVTSSFTQVFSQRIISNYNQGRRIYSDVSRLVIKLFQFGVLPFLIVGIAGPFIFNLFFGETWIEAGKYMRILIPWIFMVLVSSPLSFLPDMLKRQRMAMWLDVLKIALRIPALAIGVYYNNIYLAIVLFSLVSTLTVGYNLYWYLYLAKNADINRKVKVDESVELPERID